MGLQLRPLSGAGFLLAALASIGCQNFHTLVTGEPLRLASKETRRVELEVFVEFHGDLFAALEGESDLMSLFEERVLEYADLGLRFYPVATDEYRSGQVNPSRMLIVSFTGLNVVTEHALVEEPDTEPRIESSIEKVSCALSASIGKRRPNAPALVIGHATGEGSVQAKEADEAQPGYLLRSEAEADTPPVSRADLIEAVDEALVEALRELIEPVDRELATAAKDRLDSGK